jgi:hypothetical protein
MEERTVILLIQLSEFWEEKWSQNMVGGKGAKEKMAERREGVRHNSRNWRRKGVSSHGDRPER